MPTSTNLSVRKFTDRSAQPIMLTDDKGRIWHCNSAWEKLCGYTRSEVVGMSAKILQGPDTDIEEVRRMTKLLRLGEEEAHIQIYIYKARGEGFWNDLYIHGYVHEDNLDDETPPLPEYHVAFLQEMKTGTLTDDEIEIKAGRSREIFRLKRLIFESCEVSLCQQRRPSLHSMMIST